MLSTSSCRKSISLPSGFADLEEKRMRTSSHIKDLIFKEKFLDGRLS